MAEKQIRLSRSPEMEDELTGMLRDYAKLVRAADLKNGKGHDVYYLLIRYTEESIRVIRAASPIGLAALLEALANTALIYVLTPHLQKIRRQEYWRLKVAPHLQKQNFTKYKDIANSETSLPAEILFDCTFHQLIKISHLNGLLKTTGLRKKIINRLVLILGLSEISVDSIPSQDLEFAKDTLRKIKDFRNVLHPGKLMDTADARAKDFFENVLFEGVVLITFLTEVLVSQDFSLTSSESKN
jgi:hypothetical protein